LKAEKERVAKAEAEAERAKVAEAEVLESAAVRLKREEAAAAVEVVLLCTVDISSHEADDAGVKLVILTKKRRGLFTSFSRYDSLNRFYCEGTRLYPIWCFFTSWGKRQ
jgi:hypothetical protein